jgi:hypothetical protein
MTQVNDSVDFGKCIWCNEKGHFTLEHILPEALGCPEQLVLEKGVCCKCNNNNGKLDRALLKPFEFITVINSIPRKRGRKPTISQHSTFASGYDGNGPSLFFNRERFAVETPLGKKLGAFSNSDVIERFAIDHLEAGKVKLEITQRLVFDRQAVRGLFKIALELIGFYEGLGSVRQPEFDLVRDYVMHNKGDFYALLLGGSDTFNYLPNRFTNNAGAVVVPMTILGIHFICDFDPAFKAGRNLVAAGNLMGQPAIKIP